MVRSLECCIPEKKDLSHEIGLENLKSFKSKKGTAIVAYRGSVRSGRSSRIQRLHTKNGGPKSID